MDEMVIWGFGLFLLAALIFGLEIFVPSGGLLGLVSLLSAAAGCVAFWFAGVWWGLSSTLALLVLVPLAIQFALNVVPHTPFGKQLFLQEELDSEEALARAREVAALAEAARALVGAEGVVVTDCHPVGAATIDGERVEVLSVGGVAEVGDRVRVVSVEGNTVKVRRL